MISKDPSSTTSLSPPQTPTTYMQLSSSSITSSMTNNTSPYSDQSSTVFHYPFHSSDPTTTATHNIMENQRFDNLASPESITNQHSPGLDDNRSTGGYYTNESPPPGSENDFQRSNSQSSLASTMSPHDYVDLRSPTRQDTFFPQGHMFETFPGQFGGVFAAAASAEGLQSAVNHSHHMMSPHDMDLKSPLDIKPSINTVQQQQQQQQQNQQHFYTHDVPQQGLPGGQLPSPNRTTGSVGGGAMVPLGGSTGGLTGFQGYHNHHHRPYQQMNDVFGPPASNKQDFYMQSPFYPGYPNYWYVRIFCCFIFAFIKSFCINFPLMIF